MNAYWLVGSEPCEQFRAEVIEFGRRNVNSQRKELSDLRKETMGALYSPINGGLDGWQLMGDGPFVNKIVGNDFRSAGTGITYARDSNVHVAAHHGYWVRHGAPYTVDFLKTPGGIIESNVDIFYFTPSDLATRTTLLNVYMYNLTSVRN